MSFPGESQMELTAPVPNPDVDPMGKLLDQYLDTNKCQHGDIVAGVIVSVTSKSILIDIGGKCDAIVQPREVERMSFQSLNALKPGQEVNAYVLDSEKDDGTVTVSLARAAQQGDWEIAHKALRSKETVSLNVIEANKGGVIVRMGKLRGFVPGSQLSSTWRVKQNNGAPEHRWDALIGEDLNLTVIEVTPERNRLILSERNTTDRRQSKRNVLAKLEVGSIVEGTVSNVVPFGAFVNVKGVDGLLHVSELSWRRIDNPREFLQVGQSVKVFILDIDLDQERLGLSLKRLVPDPWSKIADVCSEGQVVAVKIVNLTTFGAFAAMIEHPEIEGLIHISELSEEQIAHPGEVVELGEIHQVRIISLRPEERRIAFSIKEVQSAETAQ
jgi:small subunit ribosomal protein S1